MKQLFALVMPLLVSMRHVGGVGMPRRVEIINSEERRPRPITGKGHRAASQHVQALPLILQRPQARDAGASGKGACQR